jgi:hypothetical protein
MDSYVVPEGDLVFIDSLVQFNQLWADILSIGPYGLEANILTDAGRICKTMSPTTSTLRQYSFKS